jgi:hypothetical protein
MRFAIPATHRQGSTSDRRLWLDLAHFSRASQTHWPGLRIYTQSSDSCLCDSFSAERQTARSRKEPAGTLGNGRECFSRRNAMCGSGETTTCHGLGTGHSTSRDTPKADRNVSRDRNGVEINGKMTCLFPWKDCLWDTGRSYRETS